MTAGHVATDTTTATVTLPDGARFDVAHRTLSPTEAQIAASYAAWLTRAQLTRKLYCRTCGPEMEVQVSVDNQSIGFLCNHQWLAYDGPLPYVETLHPSQGESVIAPVRFTVPTTDLSTADAYVLRQWDKLCRAYGLREALWCLVCEDEGSPSGVRADTSQSHYVLACRCQRRVHTGLAL